MPANRIKKRGQLIFMNTDLDSQPDIENVTGNGCCMIGGNPSEIKVNPIEQGTKQKDAAEYTVLKIFPKDK